MTDSNQIWLVTNPASGSNEEAAWQALEERFAEAGCPIARSIRFPDEALPSAGELDEAGIETVAVFAGDGTVSALVAALYGWGGAILVLPGGTMNLLYHRLHGERETDAVIAAFGAGQTERTRPTLIRGPGGDALTGVMAGPGTSWNTVREAMRDADIAGMAQGAAEAIEQSVSAPMVACTVPALGRSAGYPLLMLTPRANGISVDAYHSESVDEYLAQGMALLARDFRDGPHDWLGEVGELTLESTGGEEIGLLVDGEPGEGGAEETFVLARCEVDLLATGADD